MDFHQQLDLDIDLLIPDEESLISNQNQIEKELILEEIMSEMGRGNEFSVTTLITAVIMLLIVVTIFGIKIHFSNKIYKLSREIYILKSEKNLLNEQNSVIRMKLEQQKFKTDVVDAIF
jgi:hypothetical protein